MAVSVQPAAGSNCRFGQDKMAYPHRKPQLPSTI